MTETPQKIAIIDLGSNAVRFGVYALTPSGWVREKKDHAFTQLIRAGTEGALNPEGIEKTFSALARYGQEMRNPTLGVQGYVAVATEGIRSSSNGSDFIARIAHELGIIIDIIDGETEARLGAYGIQRAWPDFDGVVVDLGGGSLQLTALRGQHIGSSLSLPLGVQRILGAPSDPADYIAQQLPKEFPGDMIAPKSIAVIGGSLRSFAELYRSRAGENHGDLHGIRLETGKVRAMTRWLNDHKNDPVTTVTQGHNIHLDRARFLPAAGLVLTTLIDRLDPNGAGLEDIRVSTTGIRDGLLQEVALGVRALQNVPPPPRPGARAATQGTASSAQAHTPS